MRRALSTRTRSNISASRELRGGVKWSMAIQAMRPAPGSRTNAAPSAANEYTTVPAVQRTRQKSVASGGGSHHRWMCGVRQASALAASAVGPTCAWSVGVRNRPADTPSCRRRTSPM